MNRRLTNFYKLILASAALISSSALANQKIEHIEVIGNKRIETSTIKKYMDIKEGDALSVSKNSKAIKNLYATSIFENITINFNKSTLFVQVTENPFVTKLEFKGNSKISSSKFSKELQTNVGEHVSEAKLQHDVNIVKEAYRRSGRYAVDVNAELVSLSNNRAKVVFNVTEGPKTSIKHIYFAGNKNYRDHELKQIILTKETAWYKFLDTNDTYDPERMEYDKELIRQFYQSVGYADARVISATAELAPTKEYFTATYSIEEGQKYNIGTISAESNVHDVTEEMVLQNVTVKTDDLFNMTSLEHTGETIATAMKNKGYPQLSVYPQLTKHADKKKVDVKFIVERANKVFINKINIEGNTRTNDSVIRREFKIAEEDIFDNSKIEKSDRNLRNLDYFSKVAIGATNSKVPGKYDLNVKVQEKSTASASFDVGYSTAEGPFGSLGYREKNLLGEGKYLNLGTRRAKKKTSYNFGITDPNYKGRDLSVGMSMFSSQSGETGSGFGESGQPYALNTYGSRFNLGYELAEDLTHDLDYTIKVDKLSVHKESASIFIEEQKGKYITSSVGQSFTYDRTDNRVLPKNGYITSLSQEYAGVGGNNFYFKNTIENKYFKSFFDNNLTFKLAGEVGQAQGTRGKKVRINDRFQLGDYSFRGFAPSGIGPRDKRTDEALGGQKYYTLTAECLFPVGLPEDMNFYGSAFTDYGALWKVSRSKSKLFDPKEIYDYDKPRMSAGLGFLWITRMAPIKVDWALPIKKQKYDEPQRWHIRMSTHF